MQLELIRAGEAEFRAELERRTGMTIALTLTDNTSSLMAFNMNPAGTRARLRIHHMFLRASPQVVGALATWLVHRRHKRSAALLDSFIHSHEHLIRKGRRTHKPRTAGEHHDLQACYDELNAEEFGHVVTCPITWGRASSRSRRRSIRLGSYSPEDELIRIHPNLDRAFVPDYFVRYIVFHEMLHAFLGVEYTPKGRRRVHTPEFNRREKAYRKYARAMEWHDAPGNLDHIMKNVRKAS